MSNLAKILAQPTVAHDLVQGTPGWDLFRLNHRGASEASAALGLSKKVQRNELLHAKHTGLPREFSDWLQKNVLDKGHEVEATAKPHIEQIVGEPLYALTYSRGILSASCDGITMDGSIAAEHKQWNDELAAMVSAGVVPDEHMPQCQQILLVTQAEELYFVVSDGTPEKMVYTKVLSDRAWWKRIADGWAQFDTDLAAYVLPAAEQPKPTGHAPERLPALRIEITGAVTASNLAEFRETALGAIRSVNRELASDQHFADAELAVKWCGEVESRIKAAKDHALSQTASIDALFRTLDEVSAEARRVRLDLEKLVDRRKVEIKGELVAAAKSAYERHEQALRQETGAWRLLTPPDFGGAIKGKRSVSAMRDALDTTLANAKIIADESARTIRTALAALDEESKGFEHLFSDRLNFIGMIPEAVRLMVKDRIAKHQAAEQARAAELAEKERERIRAEEQAKAEKEAREKVEAEQRAQQEHTLATAPPSHQTQVVPAASPIASPASISPAVNVVPMGTRAPKTPPSMTVGQIGQRLGFPLTADFLATLGFEPAGTARGAKLYHDADFPLICMALISHITAVAGTMTQQELCPSLARPVKGPTRSISSACQTT